ncbi:MAG: hypothetical protein ACE5M4_02715 [Anaerolineales bacterium]
MELGAILFSLAMILLVGAYVLQPLAGSSRSGYGSTSRKLSALQAECDRILDSILEVDMDHSMGKVPEEAYQRQRLALALEGAAILRSIDELQGIGIPAVEAGAELRRKTSTTKEMELEAAVARLRGKSSAPTSRVASDHGEAACSECGQAIVYGDRFCANCGAALEEQVA